MTSKFRLRASVLAFGVTLIAATAIAQTPAVPESDRPQLTASETASLQARVKERRRQAGAESARIRGVTHGVSVGVRCAEGYIERQRITPSVADVEIVATLRTDCDGARCRALQVNARRAEGPFDLDVDIACSGS